MSDNKEIPAVSGASKEQLSREEMLSAENDALETALGLTRRRLRAMRDVGLALAGRLDLDQLFVEIIGKVSEITDCDRASLFFVDSERGEIWSRVAEGISPDGEATDADDAKTVTHATIRLPIGSGIAGSVAAGGVALNLEDVYEDARFNREVDLRTGYRTKSLLAVPIFNEEGIAIGVIEALNKRGGPFSVEDERLLEAVSHQLSVAMTDALLFEQLRKQSEAQAASEEQLKRRVQELDLLRDVDAELSRAADLDEFFSIITERLHSMMGADAVTVARIDSKTGQMVCRAASGDAKDRVVGRALSVERGIIGAAVSSRKTIRVEDARADDRHDQELALELGLVAGPLVAVPIVDEGKSLGAIEIMRAENAHPFTAEDENAAALLANRVGAAISTATRRETSRKEEKMATIGHMLSGIVHDFKTPMTVISGYVQLMSMTEDEAEREEAAEIVLKQTELMASMTRELLQFARGETEILIRKVYVQSLMREVEQVLSKIFERNQKTNLVMNLEYKGAVRVDETKIKRALSNLARNALEAMWDDGGTCTVAVTQAGDQIEFAVSDTGPGLPPELDGRLFETFATHGKEDGTGLGLALVKKIVDDHNGAVRVENRPGEGVTFRLRIPL